MKRDPELEKKIGEYFEATKGSDTEIGHAMFGQPMAGSSLEEHLIECIYRGTSSDRDMDEEVHDVMADPGMYADMAWQVMWYLKTRGVVLD